MNTTASLRLPENALSGSIPTVISELAVLGMYGVRLLGFMSFLKKTTNLYLLALLWNTGHLDLSTNALIGTLPSRLGVMTELSKLTRGA
jgi:hypothetical protein